MAQEAKKCRKCGSTDIALSCIKQCRLRCRSCVREYQRAWERANSGIRIPQKAKRRALYGGADMRKFRNTTKGVAHQLRSRHNFDQATADTWARVLTNPNTRCECCGIPQKMIKVYVGDSRHWILGNAKRLSIDHCSPGVNDGNYRPLCVACNSTRGANQLTDEEVLQIVRGKWLWSMTPRFLWWLNTSPGVGGKLNRSERCRKRDVRLAAREAPAPNTSSELRNTA